MQSQEKLSNIELSNYLNTLKNGEVEDSCKYPIRFSKLSQYEILPVISNERFSYKYIFSTKEIVESNNENDDNILFGNYDQFRKYYLNINQRVILPDRIEGLYSNCSSMLASNFILEQDKILNLDKGDNKQYFLNILKDALGKDPMTYNIDNLELDLLPEISYNGIETYEISLLVYFGELLLSRSEGKWIIYKNYNALGEVYYTPDIVINGLEIHLLDILNKALYGEGNDKILNLNYVVRLGIGKYLEYK